MGKEAANKAPQENKAEELMDEIFEDSAEEAQAGVETNEKPSKRKCKVMLKEAGLEDIKHVMSSKSVDGNKYHFEGTYKSNEATIIIDQTMNIPYVDIKMKKGGVEYGSAAVSYEPSDIKRVLEQAANELG